RSPRARSSHPGYSSGVARLADRLPENADGLFFVDRSCIDCDLCRQLAPKTFARSDTADRSLVQRQPGCDDDLVRAGMALTSCPTSSIGTTSKVDLKPALAA